MRVLRTLAVAGVAAAASVANAAIIDTWSYTVTTEFITSSVCFETTSGGAQAGPGCAVPTALPGNSSASTSQLKWGLGVDAPPAPGTQSSLTIGGSPASSTIDTTKPPFSLPTGTEIGLTQTFTHENNPIFRPYLDFVDVETTLLLTPLLPAGGAAGTEPPVSGVAALTFNINFKETTNSGTCDPASELDPPVSCPDIFVIGGGFNAFSFSYDSDGDGGDAPQQYFVQIFPFPPGSTTLLSTLSDTACAKAGASSGCQGFITEEGQSNRVQFGFALTTEPFGVPEPGTLALFAAALVGLGFTVRSRQA